MQALSHDIGVIGTVSFDILHVAGNVMDTIGGAGLYTALAAHRAGVNTHLMAPRPDPMPRLFAPVIERVHWTGPVVAPEALPRLEIVHHGQGRATLLDASWGAEAELTPSALSIDKRRIAMIHIAALSSARRQLEFVQAIRAMGGEEALPRISVGTYARLVDHETEVVRQLFRLADCFFMNENEAQGLFGTIDRAQTRPDALLCVTLGDQGALVIEGDRATHVPAHVIDERDPTGAGDTFCGATLAGLAMGMAPVVAAERAVEWAARTVSDIGPASLLG
jgi:ribokinase